MKKSFPIWEIARICERWKFAHAVKNKYISMCGITVEQEEDVRWRKFIYWASSEMRGLIIEYFLGLFF